MGPKLGGLVRPVVTSTGLTACVDPLCYMKFLVMNPLCIVCSGVFYSFSLHAKGCNCSKVVVFFTLSKLGT